MVIAKTIPEDVKLIVEKYNVSKSFSESTKKVNEAIICNLFSFTGKLPEYILPSDLYDYFFELRKRGCEESYIALNARILKSFFKWLNITKKITNARFLELSEVLAEQLKRKEIKEPTYLLPGEIKDMVKACKTDIEKVVVPLLLATGMRVSELCKLKVNDIVDPEKRVIRVYGKGGKELRIRVLEKIPNVPVMYRLLSWIARHKRKKDGLVFPYTTRYIQQVVKRVAERAKIDKNVTPHVLRHTVAVWMLEHGYTIEQVRQQLRHSSIATTQIYTRITMKDYLAATEKDAYIE